MTRIEATGRAGSIAAGLGAAASLATLGIEADRGKTLAALIAETPQTLLVFGPLFALVAYIALRPFLRQPPSRIEQGVMSTLTGVALLGATLLLIAWATERGDRFDHRWYYWTIVPWPLVAGIAMGRATLSTPWASWSHKVAAIAFLTAPFCTLVFCETSRLGERPDLVPFLITLTAYLLPVALYIVWPRRPPAPTPSAP